MSDKSGQFELFPGQPKKTSSEKPVQKKEETEQKMPSKEPPFTVERVLKALKEQKRKVFMAEVFSGKGSSIEKAFNLFCLADSESEAFSSIFGKNKYLLDKGYHIDDPKEITLERYCNEFGLDCSGVSGKEEPVAHKRPDIKTIVAEGGLGKIETE